MIIIIIIIIIASIIINATIPTSNPGLIAEDTFSTSISTSISTSVLLSSFSSYVN